MASITPSTIEFPCDFQIKVMGKSTPTFQSEIRDIVYRHYSSENVLSLQARSSKQGNYLAISVTIYAFEQKTLDALYIDLTRHPDVKMVL